MRKPSSPALCFSAIPICNFHTEIISIAQLCVSNITYTNALQAQPQTLSGGRPNISINYQTWNQIFLSSANLFLYSMKLSLCRGTAVHTFYRDNEDETTDLWNSLFVDVQYFSPVQL